MTISSKLKRTVITLATSLLIGCGMDPQDGDADPRPDELESTSSQEVLNGPLRGIHLPNRFYYMSGGMTWADRRGARQLHAGMAVVLSNNINPTTIEYLRDDLLVMNPSAEIFVRWMPSGSTTSSCPPVNTTSRVETGSRTYTRDWSTSVVPAIPARDVASSIIATYDLYKNTYGLTLQRWLPGNEPELEWNYAMGNQQDPNKWRDINAYYTDIWLWVRDLKGARNIELYTPAFSQYGSVGVGSYAANCAVSTVGAGVPAGSSLTGLDYVRQMVDTYRNFTWHNYFYPGCAWQQRVNQFFPQWLKDNINIYGYPSRITEAGWHPQYTGDRDAWTIGPSWSGWYEQDMEWFILHAAGAGGVAVWLLGSDDASLDLHVGMRRQFDPVDSPQGELSKMRPWFYNFIKRARGQANYRDGLGGGLHDVSLNPPTITAPASVAGSPAWAAFDGVNADSWSSGGMAPQTIHWNFENGGSYWISSVRALTAQAPAGTTTHNLFLWNGAAWQGPYTSSGHTTDNQWITFTVNPPVYASKAKLKTTVSPSWVAWREIETLGSP